MEYVQLVKALPTILATINRYTIYGSPHPKLGLADLLKAAIFKKLYGRSLLPPNDQSDMARRLDRNFPQSVTSNAMLLEPSDSKYYQGELNHLEVQPKQVPAFFLTPKKQLAKGIIVLYIHGGGYSL